MMGEQVTLYGVRVFLPLLLLAGLAAAPVSAAENPAENARARMPVVESPIVIEIVASARRMEERLKSALSDSETALRLGLPGYFGTTELGPEFAMSGAFTRFQVPQDLARKYADTTWMMANQGDVQFLSILQDPSACNPGFGAMIAPMSTCSGRPMHIHHHRGTAAGQGGAFAHLVPERVTLLRLHW